MLARTRHRGLKHRHIYFCVRTFNDRIFGQKTNVARRAIWSFGVETTHPRRFYLSMRAYMTGSGGHSNVSHSFYCRFAHIYIFIYVYQTRPRASTIAGTYHQVCSRAYLVSTAVSCVKYVMRDVKGRGTQQALYISRRTKPRPNDVQMRVTHGRDEGF